MSNYNSLKTTIDANIKQNGRQEITGQILNSVLNQMVTTLGAGYQFAGVATTATNPGSPDAKVFYIANGKGTYTNFGGINVTEDEVVVLYWDSSWHKVSTGIASQEKLTELGQEVNDKLDGPAEENPDFLRVYTDSDGNILWGIKPDGDIYFGVGVPSQVRQEILQFIQNKVDKETGKSLIDEEFADAQTTENNPEWLDVKTDDDGKILEGIMPNGEKFVNGLNINGNKQNNISDVEEWISAVVDRHGKILGGRTKDGAIKEFIRIETPRIDTNSIFTKSIKGLNKETLNNLGEEINHPYSTLLDAVNEKKTGIIQVGENVVVGLKKLEGNFSPLDIESAYRSTLPNPLFPFIKKVELQRLYDDAQNPNKLYVCSHSQTHIFYSIAPTDPRRTAQSGYYSSYAANYFYYANKETPSDIHKVVLPEYYDGKSMTRRISFVFELSNGDCFVEMDNGDLFDANYRHYCIYKVKGVFDNRTITQDDVSLSLSFDYGFAKISSFDNIVEYKAGHIILAPYSGGRSAKVYITKDYGDSWDLIFSGNSDNTEKIKPKAEHFGEDDAVGIYPTPDLLNPEGAIDWNGTLNGNVHVHGIAYDRWYDRIWIVTGDGGDGQLHNVTGIWWTDDEGYTWKRIGGYMEIGTQLIGIIPMEHCVLFPTDGAGDGYWRWSRNGKDSIIEIEECFNFYGYSSSLLVAGGRSTQADNGFYLTTFAPENDYINKGGVIATFNGFSFQKIYEDNYSEGTFETQEVGWACDICDTGSFLILGAYQGGYIKLTY